MTVAESDIDIAHMLIDKFPTGNLSEWNVKYGTVSTLNEQLLLAGIPNKYVVAL